MKTVYLDNAATTQIRAEVKEVLAESIQGYFANPSSSYSLGRKSKAAIEAARKQIATYVGVQTSEIIFTSGGTEANNYILQTVTNDLGVKHIITSRIEHHAVLKVIEQLKSKHNIKVSFLPILSDGNVCLKTLESLLTSSEEKTMVSLLHVNNEIGTILDLDIVGKLCEQNNALFHSDMVQSIGYLPLNLTESKIHFATASAHKFYGPKGIGFAVIKRNIGAKALLLGGEQERGLRAGTENIHGIIGMAEALKLCYENIEKETKYVFGIKQYAIESFKKGIIGISFNALSDTENSKFNLLNVCLPITNEKAAIVLFQLDMVGICCSRGSACQSGSNKPSHVLAEFLSANKLAKTSLRFSFSMYTTKDDIDYLILNLKKILAE